MPHIKCYRRSLKNRVKIDTLPHIKCYRNWGNKMKIRGGVSFDSIQRMYWFSRSRKEKSRLLDKLCQEWGCHRKHAIRALRGDRTPRSRKKPSGPKPRYEVEVFLKPLKAIWFGTDQMCGKRLKKALPLWLPSYEATYGELAKETRNKLLKMSPSTMDRLLRFVKLKHKRRGLAGTRPGTLLKTQIPIKTDHWDVTQPGYMEADTVAHGGQNIAGDYVWSITLTDIYSGWTELRATWNKGADGVVRQIQDIESRLPFILRGFDCDNGSEFLNYHLIRYLCERKSTIQFTRSRPYRKNDNAHVEQKNWTHVRALFGYDRFENPILVKLMNDLYTNEWSLLKNYFHPTMKLDSKEKINSKYRRKYHPPATPYERLMGSSAIKAEEKKQLKATFDSLNPFELKKQIEEKLKQIFKFVDVSKKVKRRL